MNVQYMTSSELKNRAKDLLDGRYGSAMLILFLGNMLPWALATMVNSFSGAFRLFVPISPLIRIILSLLVSSVITFFTNIFSAGYALFFLNMACRRRCEVSNLFYGFRCQFRKCLALSGFFTAVSFALQLPCTLCYGMFRQTENINWVIGALLAATVALILSTFFTLVFSQCYYLMLDFPDYPAKRLLQGSMRIMRGHLGRLFYLRVSFVPLLLLGALTCGIGMLWLHPYMQMTAACFFLDIMNPRKEQADAV